LGDTAHEERHQIREEWRRPYRLSSLWRRAARSRSHPRKRFPTPRLYWEFPINQYLLKGLTFSARVIVFDKRGQGLSDRVGEQTVEERTGDVRS
jgi:hypothetical protein